MKKDKNTCRKQVAKWKNVNPTMLIKCEWFKHVSQKTDWYMRFQKQDPTICCTETQLDS